MGNLIVPLNKPTLAVYRKPYESSKRLFAELVFRASHGNMENLLNLLKDIKVWDCSTQGLGMKNHDIIIK